MCKLGVIYHERLKTEITLLLSVNRKSYGIYSASIGSTTDGRSDHEWSFHCSSTLRSTSFASHPISAIAELLVQVFCDQLFRYSVRYVLTRNLLSFCPFRCQTVEIVLFANLYFDSNFSLAVFPSSHAVVVQIMSHNTNGRPATVRKCFL